jgi:hypothetical protein
MMIDESKNVQSASDTGGGGVAAAFGKDTSVLESKIKLWTAIVTFLGVLVGFAYTGYQLLDQGRDLQRIEQNFSSLETLRTALMRPLEGLWDYEVEYIHYFGEKQRHRFAIGKAVFIWHGNSSRIGYFIIIGAGVKEIGKDRAESIVTYVIDFF